MHLSRQSIRVATDGSMPDLLGKAANGQLKIGDLDMIDSSRIKLDLYDPLDLQERTLELIFSFNAQMEHDIHSQDGGRLYKRERNVDISNWGVVSVNGHRPDSAEFKYALEILQQYLEPIQHRITDEFAAK